MPQCNNRRSKTHTYQQWIPSPSVPMYPVGPSGSTGITGNSDPKGQQDQLDKMVPPEGLDRPV